MSNWKNKRILVTGATGLIGSHLVKQLLQLEAQVIIIGRNEDKIKKVFEQELNNPLLSYIVGNISNGFPNITGHLDYIFHAAGPISGKDIKSKPVDTITANLNGLFQCLEFLRKQKQGRLTVFSSATVYGNVRENDRTVNEADTELADTLHSDSAAYSESKRMIEVVAQAYRKQFQVDSVIVRIGYVYGYTDSVPETAFYEFMNNAINGKDIVLNHAGMGRRDNIYIDDVIAGLLLVSQKGISGEAYNISSNGEADNYKAIDELAQIIADSINRINSNRIVNVVIPEYTGGRNAGSKLDNTKIHKLGWKVSVSLEEGVARTVEDFYKAHLRQK